MNDRLLRAYRRAPVDATPVWFMRQAGRALPEYRAVRERATLDEIIRDAALCAEVTLQPVRRLGVDGAIIFADITTPLPGMGVEVRFVEGVGPVIDRPIRAAADVRALRPFDPSQAVGPLLEAIRLVRRASPVPVLGFAGAPFTLASYLVEGRSSRDAGRLVALLRADPGTFQLLLERLTEATLAYLRAQVEAGAQAVQLFDSWVGVLGPFDYQRHVLPHLRRLLAGLADLDVPTVLFGTGTAGLLGLQAGLGASAIGLDWRVDLGEAWARLPGLAVQGNLDPTLLLGPFEGTAAAACWILERAGGRPGHVFNLGHGVLPSTDPDDLRRLVDLVHERSARSAD
ncbi:MAG: uroporphyrinogen decarboxylase [Candidatus Limnocylindrales bacterium]